jgi:hypothetical protein
MAIRQVIKDPTQNAELVQSIRTEEPYVFAHLIKFEKPANSGATGDSRRQAKDYSYIADSSVNVQFDDSSVDAFGSSNGVQTYIANKVISVGGINETVRAKASNMTLQLSGTAIGITFIESTGKLTSDTAPNAGDFTFTQDFRALGLREGDTILLEDNTVDAELKKGDLYIRIDDLGTNTLAFTVITGNLSSDVNPLSYNISLASHELQALVLSKNSTNYSSYINREAIVYRAHLNPETGAIIGAPFLLFRGIVSSGSIKDNVLTSSVVSWTLTSHWGDFLRVAGRMTSDEAHRSLNSSGVPDLDGLINEDYANDLGFIHAEKSINLVATYQREEVRYKTKKRGGLSGLMGGTRLIEYRELVDTDVDLNFNLSAKYLPVVYGVQKISGIPIFADSASDDPSEVYVAQALCEGPIEAIYDIYLNDQPTVCINKADADNRGVDLNGNNEVTCAGRADQGFVLTSNFLTSFPSGNGLTPNLGLGGEGGTFTGTFGQFGYFSFSGNVNFLNGLNNTAGVEGLLHEQTYFFTSPSVQFTIHTGKPDQKANGMLADKAASLTPFKVQQDYYTGTPGEYWGGNHRLLDTAYSVMKFKLDAGETTIPEYEFVVKGKTINCYNYDGSYNGNGLAGAEDSFILGDVVNIYTPDEILIVSDAMIIDKFIALGKVRFRFSKEIPVINTSFYMTDAVTPVAVWNMTSDEHLASATVPKELVELPFVTLVSRTGDLLFTSSQSAEFQQSLLTPSYIKVVLDGYDNFFIAEVAQAGGDQILLAGSTDLVFYQRLDEIIDDTGRNASIYPASAIKLNINENALTAEVLVGSTLQLINPESIQGSPLVDSQKVIAYYPTSRIVQLEAPFLQSGIQPVTGTLYAIKGTDGFDLRASNNPALQLLDYLKSDRYGKGLKDYEIDLESFLASARACDDRSDVTVISSGDISTSLFVGKVFDYKRIGAGAVEFLAFQGTVSEFTLRTINGSLFTEITFSDVIGKLGNKWKDYTSFKEGDLVWHDGVAFLATTSGTIDEATRDSLKTSSLQTQIQITSLDNLTNLLLNCQDFIASGNPIVKSFTSLAVGFTNIGYSLYDSDECPYWVYLGWDTPDQRNVTRHQTNQVIETSTSVFDNVNSMLDQFNGILRYANGTYQLDIKSKAPTFFDEDIEDISQADILGELTVDDKGIKNTYNSITSQIIDPANRFGGRSINFMNSKYKKEDKGVVRNGTFSMPGVSNYYNARISTKQFLDESRFGLNIKFTVGTRGYLLLAGSIIRLTYTRFGWDNKFFRIEDLSFSTEGLVTVSATEHNNDAYILESITSGASSIGADAGNASYPVVYRAPLPPTGLVASADSVGAILLNITNGTDFDSAKFYTAIYRAEADTRELAEALPKPATPIAIVLTDTYSDVLTSSDTVYRAYWIEHGYNAPNGTSYVSSTFPTVAQGAIGNGSGAAGGVAIDGVAVYQAPVYYRVGPPNSTTDPLTPATGDGTYNFATNTLVAPTTADPIASPNTWSTTIPGGQSWYPVFVSLCTFTAQGAVVNDETSGGDVQATTWTVPKILTGETGVSTYSYQVFARAELIEGLPDLTTLVAPDAGSYNFGSNTTITPTGWSTSVPVGDGNVWVSTALVSTQGDIATDDTPTYSTPIRLVQGAVTGSFDHPTGTVARRSTDGVTWTPTPTVDQVSNFSFKREGEVIAAGSITWELQNSSGDMFVFAPVTLTTGTTGAVTLFRSLDNSGGPANFITLTHVDSGTVISAEYTSVEDGNTGSNAIFSNLFDTVADQNSLIAVTGATGVTVTSATSDSFSGAFAMTTTSTVSSPSSAGLGRTSYLAIPEDLALRFAGQTVTVSLYAKAIPGNESLSFSIAYSTSEVGNSGFTSFVPTSSFSKYEIDYLVPLPDVGGLDYIIISPDDAGSGKGIIIDNVQCAIKAEKGETGASGINARSVQLTPNSSVISYNTAGLAVTTSITLDAVARNTTGTLTYAFFIDGSVTAAQNGGSPQFIFDTEIPGTYSTTPISIRVELLEGGVLAATDEVTLSPIKSGSDVLTATNSNEAHVFPASVEGVVSSYTGSGTAIQVFQGSTNLTYVTGTGFPTGTSTFRIETPALVNIVAATPTGQNSTTATFGVASGVSDAVDASTITYTIRIRNDVGQTSTITKVQSFSKSRIGATGDDAVYGGFIHEDGTTATRDKTGTWDSAIYTADTATEAQSNKSTFSFVKGGVVLAAGDVFWHLSTASGSIYIFDTARNVTGTVTPTYQVFNNNTRSPTVRITCEGVTIETNFTSVIEVARRVSSLVYYQLTSTNAPVKPTGTITFNYDTGLFTGLTAQNWDISPPIYVGANGNKYWVSFYTADESGAITFQNAVQSTSFTGLVTFQGGTFSDGTNTYDTTQIDGANITTGSIFAEKIDIASIFAEKIAVTDTITVESSQNTTSVILKADDSSPLRVRKGIDDLLSFDSGGKLVLKGGLGKWTIDTLTAFEPGILSQLKNQLTEGSTGGSFETADLSNNASPVGGVTNGSVIMSNVNTSTVNLSCRFFNFILTSSAQQPKWTLLVTAATRATSGNAFGAPQTVHNVTYTGTIGADQGGITDQSIDINFAQAVDLSGSITVGGDVRIVYTVTRVQGQGVSTTGDLVNMSASQAVQGGGVAGAANSLLADSAQREGAYFLDYTNMNAGTIDGAYLPAATTTVKGGIELGSAAVQSAAAAATGNTPSRTYPLQLNDSGQGVINVPWVNTNTTYALATTSVAGLAPIRSGVATEYLNGVGSYSTLPDFLLASSAGTTYLARAGGTMSGNILFSNSGTTKRGIQGTNADNDFWFIGGGATATNSGFMEIATGDDGQSAGAAEPIYISQYGPGDPLTGTLVRQGALLDANGDTNFPGTVTAPTFSGALTGNAATVTNGVYTNNTQTISGLKTFTGRADFIRSTTIGGEAANIGNAWLLIGSVTSGIGIDNNELYCVGQPLNFGTPTGSDNDIVINRGGTTRLRVTGTGASVIGTLVATAFSGPLTGNVTGNVTGSSGSTTGNAATADTAANSTNLGGASAASYVRTNGNEALTGSYSTTSAIEAGRGSGGVALTVNDGHGNANVAFNHRNGVPDVSGSSARIEVSVDSTAAEMYFELGSNSVAATAKSLIPSLTLRATNAHTLVGSLTATTFIGALSGNATSANTVSNGVYTNTTQTITGAKTFSLVITGDITGSSGSTTGNAATASTSALTTDSTVLRNNAAQRIAKPAHASGSDSYHLELYSPDSGSAEEVSLRMHQGSRFYGQMRMRSDGFHFTQGDSNSYKDIYFNTAHGSLDGNATTATTAGTCTGNAATVTDGVYTTGTQTIGGTKTFSAINTQFNGFINIASAINTWKYVSLRTGTGTKWDIATNEADQAGALQFRPNGGSTNHVRITTGGEVVVSGGSDFHLRLLAFRYNDSWLRLNPTNAFTSGIYCGTGLIRTDGTFQVGSAGANVSLSASGAVFNNATTINSTLNVSGVISTSSDIAANAYYATGLGSNTAPTADDARFGGYGILGNRGSFYISNSGGEVVLNRGGVHGSNRRFSTTTTGAQVENGTSEVTLDINSGTTTYRTFVRQSDNQVGWYINNATRLRFLGASNEFVFNSNISAPEVTETSALKYKNITERVDPQVSLNKVVEIGKKGTAIGTLKSDETKKVHRWFIADEVAEVMPEVVKYADGEVDGLAYSRMLPDAYAAIAKQQEIIETLMARVAYLEDKL